MITLAKLNHIAIAEKPCKTKPAQPIPVHYVLSGKRSVFSVAV